MEIKKEREFMTEKIELYQGDITKIEVDAIVNAANKSLLGGGGVDGAIHKAAGPELKEETKTLNGAETGEAKMTKGYKLPAKYVIHTVGPVYNDGTKGEDELLKSCYENSMDIAAKNDMKTMAFPAISTGVYGYPIEEATTIAIDTVKEKLKEHSDIEKVYLVTFSDEDYNVYDNTLNK